MSSTVSWSRAAQSVSVSSRIPAQIWATPTGWVMNSSPEWRSWSAWRSQANSKARLDRLAVDLGRRVELLDHGEEIGEELLSALSMSVSLEESEALLMTGAVGAERAERSSSVSSEDTTPTVPSPPSGVPCTSPSSDRTRKQRAAASGRRGSIAAARERLAQLLPAAIAGLAQRPEDRDQRRSPGQVLVEDREAEPALGLSPGGVEDSPDLAPGSASEARDPLAGRRVDEDDVLEPARQLGLGFEGEDVGEADPLAGQRRPPLGVGDRGEDRAAPARGELGDHRRAAS